MNAISNVPTTAARHVAMNTPPRGMPATERMFGFTARMYAIVMNVVRPATSSVRTVVLFSSSLNSFLSMSFFFRCGWSIHQASVRMPLKPVMSRTSRTAGWTPTMVIEPPPAIIVFWAVRRQRRPAELM